MERDPDASCGYAEHIMVDRVATVPLDSDVLIGQHHGADNSTSRCFIQAVTPQYVVFSAGHAYNHPRQATVDRLTTPPPTSPPGTYRVALANIFRTDLGDNEGGTEMTAGSGTCPDPTGDDDVEVRLPASSASPVSVAYRGLSARCGP
jgi:competence protein ComEC